MVMFIKICAVLYSYYIIFIQMSVRAQNSNANVKIFQASKKKTNLDFQTVLKKNSKFARLQDKCPLRINGGIEAGKSSVPYQVALRRELQAGRLYMVFCGGAIITESHILTARSCFNSVSVRKIMAVAGTGVSDIILYGNLPQRLTALKKIQAEESWRTVKTCHSHYKFDNRKMTNDFAVLELRKPFVLSTTVKPVKIMSYEVQEAENVVIADNTLCVVSGYGLMENKRSDTLKMVCLPLVNLNICKKVYPDQEHPNVTQLCADKDAAHSYPGDSGGPLVCKGLLVGIVSYGGKPGKIAGVYTFLRGYTDKKENTRFRTCSSIKLCYKLPVVTVLTALTVFNVNSLTDVSE